MKIIKAIYNFIVGDMVILIGVALTVTVLALILMDVEMPGKEELRLWNKWMQGIFKHFTRKTLA